MGGCGASSCGCGVPQSAGGGIPGSAGSPTVESATVESHYAVPGMDCPAEERLVRMALQGVAGLGALRFDLRRRELRVQHAAPVQEVTQRLAGLNLGARLLASQPLQAPAPAPAASDAAEARVLRWLLGINAAMFVVELVAGWLAQSTGLMADALDMLADAAVYGLALLAVGQAAAGKRRAARAAGWLQLLLAAAALAEVLRRLWLGSEPEPPLMMGISALALLANVSCMALLARHRDGGVHMRASWIFSTNDVLANLGVIAAGALVAWTGSNLPDLLIGTAIVALVALGAWRILRLPG